MIRTISIFTMHVVLLLALVCSVGAAGNDPLDEIARDFAEIEGTLILARGEQYLVDLDSTQGLRAGDLLVAISGGEPVVHPRSGQVIGTLGGTRTVFLVAQVDRGFSRLQRLEGDAGVSAGTPLVRWRSLSAVFVGSTPGARGLYGELQQKLPQLLWQGDFTSTADLPRGTRSDLVFSYDGGRLQVSASSGRELHAYALRAESPSTAAAVAPLGDSQEAKTGPGSGYRPLGRLPGATRMASFCRVEEQLLLAATDGRRLRLYAVSSDLEEVAELPLPGLEDGLAVSWWQPTADGHTFLVVTAAIQRDVANSPSVETEISSSIYTYDDGHLQRSFHLIGLQLGSFDVDGDGRYETLFAEPFPEAGSPPRLEQVRIVNGKLERRTLTTEVPAGFSVIGSAVVDLDGDGSLEFAGIADGFLTIDGDGHPAYRSARKFGGSLSRLTYDRVGGGVAPLYTTKVFEVPPLVVDLHRDGRRELLAVSGRHGAARAPGLGPGIEDSWVSVISADQGRFQKRELGPHLETPLQGLGFDGNRLLLVSVRPNDFFGQGGQTEVLALDLAR